MVGRRVVLASPAEGASLHSLVEMVLAACGPLFSRCLFFRPCQREVGARSKGYTHALASRGHFSRRNNNAPCQGVLYRTCVWREERLLLPSNLVLI